MNKILKYISVCTFVISCFISSAQEYDDDAAVWLNVYLEKKFKDDKFDAHFTHSSRINNNVSDYGLGYGDLGLTYYFSSNIKLMGDYVFRAKRNLDGSYSQRHRAYLALLLKKEFGRFTIGYRNQFQGQLTDIYTSEYGMVPQYYDRNKLSLKYEISKRFTVSVSEELYLPLYQAKYKGFDRSRSAAGIAYKLSKKSELEFTFTYRHELNAYNRTRRDFIYGLTYSLEF